MTQKLALMTLVLVVLANGVRAEGPDLIETRQAGQDLILGTFTGIRVVVDTKGDIKKLETPAKALQRWALLFPTLFPKGTETGGNTKALPGIWADSIGFQKAAATFAAAAGRLADIARAGDTDSIGLQVKAVGDACAECHRSYRAK